MLSVYKDDHIDSGPFLRTYNGELLRKPVVSLHQATLLYFIYIYNKSLDFQQV